MKQALKVCAVLSAFNRREQTVAALRAFMGQVGDFQRSAVLMDDGSTDGTSEAVQAEIENVTVLTGDGSLFWNRGMAAAFEEAQSQDADYYLWLNDDTVLSSHAVESLLKDADEAVNKAKGSIVVGSTKDPESGYWTYGGLRAISTWHPARVLPVFPSETQTTPCDCMNGNVVLISANAARTVGKMDGMFTHSMGDYDYGLRAKRAGVSLVVGCGYFGDCPRNPPGIAWNELPSIKARWHAVNQPKGLPMREWALFLKKHGNILWPIAWLFTYSRLLKRKR